MLLGLPDLLGFVQSAGKPFLRLLATMLVESISLWHRECVAANTDLTPSWWQVHGVVTRKVMGQIAKKCLSRNLSCYKFSLSNHASSSYIVLLIADALRHPQLVLVTADSFLTRLLIYLFSAC
jgi:hypothetical protein